jgi:hypothetical protein
MSASVSNESALNLGVLAGAFSAIKVAPDRSFIRRDSTLFTGQIRLSSPSVLRFSTNFAD